MKVNRVVIPFQRSRQDVQVVLTNNFELNKILRFLARPTLWLMSVLFFVAATPFELGQSGSTYIVKIGAMIIILAYAVVIRGAQLERLNLFAIVAITILFITNLFGWTDRVIIAITAIVAATLLGQMRGRKWDRDFQFIVFVYLAVHCGGLLIAIILFYGTGQIIDLHGAVFPFASRTEAIGVVGRLSGFHTEPGTYSQWTLMALYLFALMKGRLYNIFNAFIALSVVITVSLWGVLAFGIFAVAFAIDALISPGKGQRIRLMLSISLFSCVITILTLQTSSIIIDDAIGYLMLKGEMDTQSGLDKVYALEFMRQELWNVIIIGRPFFPGFCPECISPQDAGIGMTGSYYLGFLFFTTLIIALMVTAYRRWNIAFIVPLLLLLVWKAHVYEPLLWVIIGYILKGPSLRAIGVQHIGRERI